MSSATTPDPNKKQALADVFSQIEKQFGKGSIMRLGEGRLLPVSGISTGCLSLDMALGGVGVPRDRVTEIFGPESSGKTTLTLHCIANAQRQGGVAAFIDAEHALDPTYAKKLGVDLDQLLVSQPDTGEQALEIAEMLIRSNGVDIIVIDSVAALVPKAEIEGEMGDSHVGLQARLMSQALRKLTGAISKSHCALVFINQIREKIGVMFGNPETTTGGRALKFYSSVRIDIRRIGSLKVGEEVIGSRTKATVVKNKIAPPFRKTEFDILYAEGISYLGDLIDLATLHNVVEKSGTWFSFGALRLGQGREKALEFLRANKDVTAKVESLVREKIGATGNAALPGGAVTTTVDGATGGAATAAAATASAAASAASAGGAGATAAAASNGSSPRPAVAAAMAKDGSNKESSKESGRDSEGARRSASVPPRK
ncbi:MAG: recombinase RecA [Planctomycetes bacterium]|nr:recombinase RecA [Planctomycetota bacterium]